MPDDLAGLAEWVRKTVGERELEDKPLRRRAPDHNYVLPPGTGTTITTLSRRTRFARWLRGLLFWRKR